MPERTESIKTIQQQKSKNMAITPPKGTESVHNIPPYNTENHQPLYSKEILTWKIGKDWEGFNS